MHRIFTILLSILNCSIILAQNGMTDSMDISDSVMLNEVEITETVPFDDVQVENIYKTNSFATIDNVIARLDGISLIRRGNYAMEPILNGFSGGQINITIDGMRMFGACTDRMDPVTSYIEPSNLKSIKVKHGTSGCQSGSNIGGAMDLCLKEPVRTGPSPFNISAALGYETVSRGKTALLSAGLVKNKWQWGLNGAYRHNENYKDGGGNAVPYSQFEKTNFHSVFKFHPDSNSSLKADFLYDLAQDVGYAALPMDVSRARACIIGVEYQQVKRVELKSKIYYNSVLHIMDDSQRDSLYYVYDKETGEMIPVYMRMDMPGTSSTAGAIVEAGFKLNNKDRLTLKLDNYTNHSLAEMTMYMHYPGEPVQSPMYLQTWPDMIRSVTGFYLRNNFQVNERASLSFSGRLDYCLDFLQSGLAKEQFSVFDYNMPDVNQQVTASIDIMAVQKISNSVAMNFEAGCSERLPAIGEWYGFYLYNAYDGYDYIGNPTLKPELSFFGKLIFSYTKPGIKINLDQSVNLIRDYIMGITDTTIPPMNFYAHGTRIYQNVPKACLLNTDLQMQLNPLPGLSLFLLTKFTWGQLGSGEPMPLIPPLNNVLSVSYKYRNLGFNVENETAMAQNRINEDYGEVSSPAFTLFNIKISYHLKMLAPVMADLSLAVSNLFDAQYYHHLDWGHIYRPGRSFDIFLKIII